jgi:hypothetical protein
MTHDDARLPTLEEVMNGSPFDIIDSPWGHIERWKASTLATGTMGALAQVAAIVRNDVAELEKETAALDAKKSAVLGTVNPTSQVYVQGRCTHFSSGSHGREAPRR